MVLFAPLLTKGYSLRSGYTTEGRAAKAYIYSRCFQLFRELAHYWGMLLVQAAPALVLLAAARALPSERAPADRTPLRRRPLKAKHTPDLAVGSYTNMVPSRD